MSYETHWVNQHPFQPSSDCPDYCKCGAHKAHPEHVGPYAERARQDIAYLRRQVARRCAEIAESSYGLEKTEDILDPYKQGFVTGRLGAALEIRREFGLEEEGS